jgi:outer membrane protein assembly factor BamB
MGAYPVLAAEGLVYLFPGGNEFDALDAETGDMKFKGKVSADTVSYSAAVLDNVLYLGTKDGQLHALEPTTGRDLWSTPVSGEVVGPPALCAGVLWYTATDGGLNALK